MNKYKNLKGFFIKKFIITLAVISVTECILLRILKHTLIPFTSKYFFDNVDLTDIRLDSFLIIMMALVISIILRVLRQLVPDQIGIGIDQLKDILNRKMDLIFAGTDGGELISKMSSGTEVLLFLSFFAIFLLIIFPYIVGAYYYARAVVKEVKLMEEQENQRNKEYEKKRNLMISDMAHDLKTPITTINGYSMALCDGVAEESRKQEYLEAIHTKSKRMTDLISLLLDYVKLDSEGFTLNKEEIDICEVARECAAFQYQDIEDAGMSLNVEIPEEPLKIKADKLQISRVITNLITNAVRHNPTGTTIGLIITQDDYEIRLMVADTGKRIPDSEAENLFEPFVMGDESRNSKGGTGLGLSIAKKVVEMHGFKIKLTQKPVIKSYDAVKNYEKMFMITINQN